MIVPAAMYVLLLRGRRLVRLAALTGCFLVPVVGYLGWFAAAHGQWNFTTFDGAFLYGRVADFADCQGLNLPAYERPLCPAEPPAQRIADFYTWDPSSPQWTFTPPAGRSRDAVVRDFSLRILRHQPGAYAEAVVRDFGYGFSPVRGAGPERYSPALPAVPDEGPAGPAGIRLDRDARLPAPADTRRAGRVPGRVRAVVLPAGAAVRGRARARPGRPGLRPGRPACAAAVHGQRGGRPAAPGHVRHLRLAVPVAAAQPHPGGRGPRR